MASSRIIVNEGRGPRPVDLVVPRLIVGGSPDCDVRLRDAAAAGIEFVIEASAPGHRVVRLLGELFLNEEPCDVSALHHNDTLRAGETLVLYKNPAARRAISAAGLQA
jgi:hypothetical protein